MAPLASGHISFVVSNSPKHVGYFELQTPFIVLPITYDYLEYIQTLGALESCCMPSSER